MVKKILLIIVIIVIIVIFHYKKYCTHPDTSNLNIEQLEDYIYKLFNSLAQKKNIIIIRNYKKLNNLINLDNFKKYNSQITFLQSDYQIKSVIDNKYDSFILYPIQFIRKIPLIHNLGSILTVDTSIFASYGKKDTITSIISLRYERNYIHVVKGEIIIYLINPLFKNKLYLQKTHNLSIELSPINIQKPERLLYPEYNDVPNHFVPINLKKGNLLFLPNDWSFYIFYKEDSILLHYGNHTIISKMAQYL